MSWPAAATRGALLGALILAVAAPGATAAVFTVDSTIDAVDAMPGDTHCETVDHACTLRAAVQEANELPGADEINVPAGTYEFSVSGRGDDVAASGDLDVKESLSITGQRARTTIVSAKQIDRLFDARAGQLSLSGLSLIEGRASGASDDTGGAARVNLGATLKLAGVRMSEDSAQADGSALYNAGTLDMTASSVDTVSGDDGITTAGTASLTSSTVTRGELKILGGATTIVNSTLVGGAPRASHALNIAGGSATVTNTILAGRGSGACIGAPPASGGHNLADDGTCALAGPADQSYVDPGLRQDDDSLDTLYFPLWAVGTSHDPPPNTSCDMSTDRPARVQSPAGACLRRRRLRGATGRSRAEHQLRRRDRRRRPAVHADVDHHEPGSDAGGKCPRLSELVSRHGGEPGRRASG
jgi:CSLREA domain-containing protein